jgi:uncharacterized membrane protein YccF (DUF307 family)
MKTLANVLWHIPFLGFISASLTYLLGILLTLTVVASPIGLGLMEFGKFLFFPFGNAMVSGSILGKKQNVIWKTYSTIIMILYFPLGIILTIIGILQIIGLCITIIGIPLALVVAKSLGTYLNPVNKKCLNNYVIDVIQIKNAQNYVDNLMQK